MRRTGKGGNPVEFPFFAQQRPRFHVGVGFVLSRVGRQVSESYSTWRGVWVPVVSWLHSLRHAPPAIVRGQHRRSEHASLDSVVNSEQ